MTKATLSVSIISFNEESNIGRMLEVVKSLADEIIVVDSLSTDKTVEIAKSFGAIVYSEPWKGHIAQKNSALDKCTCDWILALDCDEIPTPELIASVQDVLLSPKYNGYTLNRRTYYMGKELKYAWQPDLKLRLVKRVETPRWGGYDPHDVLMVKGATGRFKGDLTHYSFKNFADHMQKTVNHAKSAANSYYKKNKKCTPIDLLVRPWWVLFNKLILKRAILDGMPGVVSAISSAVYVYMKYSFLLEMNRQNNKG